MSKVYIIGGGGHAKVVIDTIERMIEAGADTKIEGFFDDNTFNPRLFGYNYMGNIGDITSFSVDTESNFIIAIGNNKERERIAKFPVSWFTAVHPKAIVSKHATIGKGTVIMANAVINPDAFVGDHVIINSGAIVEHDCIVNDYVHISPNAAICGKVTVGVGTHIGAGATVIQNKQIGSYSVIGAGAVVVKDIPNNLIVKGVPAK